MCCALPSLLVVLGMGATMAGLVSAVPQLVWVSQYKGIVFTVSGFLILASGLVLYIQRSAPCPIDVDQARACMRARKASVYATAFSGVLWLVGAFFAFIAIKVL